MKKSGAFSSSIKLKHVLGASASALAMTMMSSAYAQPVEEIPDALDEESSTDLVVVTGSRIRRAVDATVAVTDIDAAQFETRAFTNTIDALEELPFVGVGVNNSGNGTQFGDNNAFVNLLGFGTQRTLTLIDGRRMVSSNQGTVFVPGNASGAQVDFTIINPALIKNTEIQTVGSGPIYGADAVAGVVNVILDREFTGFDVTVQGGITQEGDGEEYRVSGAWGTELFDGKGHFIAAGEYLDSNAIYADANDRPFINIGGGASTVNILNNPFSANGGDGIPDEIFLDNYRNPQVPRTGLINRSQNNLGSTAAYFFPYSAGSAANATAFGDFQTATGMTPFAWAQANPTLNGVDPLAFVGTFGLGSGFLTVPTTDAAALALGLTNTAVPLTFDANGNAVPFNIGDIIPPNPADQNSVMGGMGEYDFGQNTIRSAQERISFNSLWSYELTPSVRYEGDFWFSEITNQQRTNGSPTQNPGASITAANFNVPIFFNENPFVTQATRDQLAAIDAANGGGYFNTIGGSEYFGWSGTMFDIAGGYNDFEGNKSRTWRTSHVLEGEFDTMEREFYWDIGFAWSQNTSKNDNSTDILDIEYALATDVVDDGSGNAVCRQQTLGAPEAVTVRNPRLGNINIDTPGGIVPTQAQIDACVPLNLFGAPSQAAIDYVTAESDSENKATQWYAAASLGGDVVQLPAGPWKFNWQVEWRREELAFTPSDVFGQGLGRSTIGEAGEGYLTFIEGGNEFNVPIFGGDVRPFGFNMLELDGAVRVVHKRGAGTPFGIDAGTVDVAPTTDVTFVAGGRWSPFEGITFRGNRTRAVRSASIVESLGAPQTGFSGLAQFFPCNGFFVNGGPASGIRIDNCNAFEASLGLAPGTFAALTPPAGTVPAGVGGNPNLKNETSNNWTVGVVVQPSFIPGLTISSDYMSLKLDDQINLAFFGTQCFDQASFPNTIVGGLNVCEAITLAVEDPLNPGTFIIPDTNIITGSPVIPPGIPGSLAPVQAPYTVAAAQFANANAGSIRLDALNSVIRYTFDLNDVMGGDTDYGQLTLNGNVYYIRRLQTSGSGTFAEDTVNNGGEPGTETIQTRLDVTHDIGRLSHTIQWFRKSAAVENVDDAAPLDEEPDYFRPEQNYFNYNIAYDLTDNITARLVVNNLTNTQYMRDLYIPSQYDNGVGRSFIFAVNARF